ncbi:MAG: sialate O-acetylesterase [Pirellulales bacterium]
MDNTCHDAKDRAMHPLQSHLSSVVLFLFVACCSPLQAAQSVRVFILAGQSNMVGAGEVSADPNRNQGKGSLEWLVQESDQADHYARLLDTNDQWLKRRDVKIWFFDQFGDLSPGYGGRTNTIGPELGFGWIMGDAFEQPVLLIKIAWGGKSLAEDFRPPSAGGAIGSFYSELISTSHEVLQNAGSLFPELDDHSFQLTGFGWHQGWNDRVNQTFNDEYEKNLSYFIRDVRKDLHAPLLPFVIAETGMSGPEEKHPRALSLMAAQAAVAKKKEFKGNVAFVETKNFYRPPEVSPSRQGYHWNNNAETYFLIGEGMGKAMLSLLDN